MRKRLPVLMAIFMLLALTLLTGAASSRSYVSNNYLLEMDGVQTGFLKSVQGGTVYANVVNEPAGPDYFVRKHISQPQYEPFQLQIGFSMARPVYEWIGNAWKMNYQRKNGAVVGTDYNYKAVSRQEFMNALITETTIPAMDGASKEPAYITLKIAPEAVRLVKSGDAKGAAVASKPDAQKAWIPSNFRLEIDGLDTSKVNKIDAFTVKQAVVQDNVGEARDAQREPGKLEFPNLKITIAAAGADDWIAWHDDFVIKGNNGQDQEKNGTLSLLSTNRQEVLAKIRLYNMGILSIRTVDTESGSDAIQRYQIELYVERMEFEGPAAPTKG